VLAHLPVPLGHAGAFVLGNTVYVAGGRDRNDRALRAEYAVDPLHGRVRKLASLPSPVADAGVAELGGNVWLIGGWNSHTLNDVLEGRFVQRRQRTLGATKAGRPNVYAATAPGDFSAAVRGVKERVYVPNSRSGTVTVIDPKTFRIIRRLRVGLYDQHITPSWDLRRLYVNNTAGNSLTVINPRSGRATGTIPVTDPYNLYFTPDGSSAIVVVESYHRLDLRDPHTWALQASIDLPVAGPNHLDFSADGSYLLISAEFSGQVVKVDLASKRVTGTLVVGGSPVDVKLAPDGSVFFVANQRLGGVSVIDPQAMRQIRFIHTGAGAHGMAFSRDDRRLYVSNRLAGTISALDPAERRLITTWKVGGSPDMIQISPNGNQLWVSNRFDGNVSVVNTSTGQLIHRIRTGKSPHGLAYFPQPGRYSLGHNGVYR
jgi:YVTN family beta-propeller protein